MSARELIGGMIEKYFSIGTVVQESDATNREVQVEGDRDETATGKEIWRAARNLGPGGFKHRCKAGAEVLVLELPWVGSLGIILGIDDDDGAPTDLDEGETAMFNTSDTTGKSAVRCISTIVHVGIGSGGLIVRKDKTTTWWNTAMTGPRAVFAGHCNSGVMVGPGQSGPPVAPFNDLGDIGDIGSTDGHKVT